MLDASGSSSSSNAPIQPPRAQQRVSPSKTKFKSKSTNKIKNKRKIKPRTTRNSNRFMLSKPSPKSFYLLFKPGISKPKSFIDSKTSIRWELVETKPVDSRHKNFGLSVQDKDRKFSLTESFGDIPPSNVLSQLIDFPTTYGFMVNRVLTTGELFKGS